MTPERWDQIDQLLQSALQRPADQRQVFLANECSRDEDLLREVGSLLKARERAGDFLERPAIEVAAREFSSRTGAVAAGAMIGPYEVLGPLGSGGMGEVYLAQDSRLGRKVALKLLLPEFARDTDRLRRFEQEARAASALNHPNILVIYDIGMHDDAPYLAAEFLEGDTLRERLDQSALSTNKAIEYAVQIARGLAAAHDKGIVHRDLKPENLFITNDGHIKILDFGLAKLTETKSKIGADDFTAWLTAPGTVMGTAGYLSPEQARGAAADHRSDIFSFGVIVYEMLAGRQPFCGESAVEVMAATVNQEPPGLGQANPDVSAALARITHRCLEKRPEDRFQSARDLAFAFETLAAQNGPATPMAASTRKRERIAWMAAGLLLLVALTSVVAYFRRVLPQAQVTRFEFPSMGGSSIMMSLAISPDGHTVAFVAPNSSNRPMLWLHTMDGLESKVVSRSEGAMYPFWSPDSRFVAFKAGGKLRKLEAATGTLTNICNTEGVTTGSWSASGVIVFTVGSEKLFRVPATGGEPMPISTAALSLPGNAMWFPAFLPDGRHFFFASDSIREGDRGIYLGSLDGQGPKRLIEGVSNTAYAPPGYLLFVREGVLLAQPFDASALRTTGDAFPVAGQVKSFRNYGSFSVSGTGVLAYRRGESDRYQLSWVDRNGKDLASVGGESDLAGDLSLSYDQRRLAITRYKNAASDIWLIDLERGNLESRFTRGPPDSAYPVWSRDGARIAYSRNDGDGWHIYHKATDQSGPGELLFKSDSSTWVNDCSPDGRYLVFAASGKTLPMQLWMLSLTAPRTLRRLLSTTGAEMDGAVSPDGHWVAYASDESGRTEVSVQAFPVAAGPVQISAKGGRNPRWGGDGKELFFISPDMKLMVVEVSGNAPFRAGVPHVLFELGSIRGRNAYTPSVDGKRFLVNRIVGQPSTTPITVVLNWAAELKR